MIPGTTPAAPDDDGRVDPHLAPLLAQSAPRELELAMLHARLLLPVVAVKAAGESDMAVPALVNDHGRRALPVFSSYDSLRRWRSDARPVPMSGTRVFCGAAAEGYDGVVLDVAGPHVHVIGTDELLLLADLARRLEASPEAGVVALD